MDMIKGCVLLLAGIWLPPTIPQLLPLADGWASGGNEMWYTFPLLLTLVCIGATLCYMGATYLCDWFNGK